MGFPDLGPGGGIGALTVTLPYSTRCSRAGRWQIWEGLEQTKAMSQQESWGVGQVDLGSP